MLRAKDSALKVKLLYLAGRQRIVRIAYTPADEQNYAAARAFEALGAKAQSALPALLDIANRNISHDSRYNAIAAMGIHRPRREGRRSVAVTMGDQCRFQSTMESN
jgi:hypothetical protein